MLRSATHGNSKRAQKERPAGIPALEPAASNRTDRGFRLRLLISAQASVEMGAIRA